MPAIATAPILDSVAPAEGGAGSPEPSARGRGPGLTSRTTRSHSETPIVTRPTTTITVGVVSASMTEVSTIVHLPRHSTDTRVKLMVARATRAATCNVDQSPMIRRP